MAETAVPIVGSPVADVATWRRLARRFGALDGVDADWDSDALLVSASGGGASVDIQPGRAVVQGTLYEISTTPVTLPVTVNGSGSDRIDYVVIRYDAATGVAATIVEGTPGAGPPGVKNGVADLDGPQWDMVIGRYTKTPAGAVTNLQDRREFVGYDGTLVGPGFGTVYLPGPGRSRTGMRLLNPVNGREWRWSGPPHDFWERVDDGALDVFTSGSLRYTTSVDAFTSNLLNDSNILATVSRRFVAPLTGIAVVEFQAFQSVRSGRSALGGYLGVKVTGPGGFSDGPGSPDTNNPEILAWERSSTSDPPPRVVSHRTRGVSGLTPGLTYTATLMGASRSAAGALWDIIRLQVRRSG